MWVGPKLWKRLRMFRAVNWSGVFGSGKTLTAVATAWYLKQTEGYRVWSNVPLTFADPVEVDLPVHTVVILDEARRYIDARDWAKNSMSIIDYCRHIDAFFLFPAAFDVDVRARRLEIRRMLPFVPLLNRFVWVFSVVSTQDEAGFPALFVGPEAYFGLYRQRGLMGEEQDLLFYVLDEVMKVVGVDEKAQRSRARELVVEQAERIRERARNLGM